MKKLTFYLLAVATFAILVSFLSCGGDDPIADLMLSASSLELTAGETNVVNITSGNPAYSVSSDNNNVATATLNGDNKSVIVTAINAGSATITVKDAEKKIASIAVTVTSAISVSSFAFIVNGNTVTDGSTVTDVDTDEYGLHHSPIHIKKIASGNITASLTISVSATSNGPAGYCGWGFDACIPVNVGKSQTSTKTVTVSDEIDPVVEALAPGSVSLTVEYVLSYGNTEQKIIWNCNK
jgi:hypothetical protein